MYYIGLRLVPTPAPEKTLKHLPNNLLQNAITAKNCRILGNLHPSRVGIYFTSVQVGTFSRSWIEDWDHAQNNSLNCGGPDPNPSRPWFTPHY
jgi:hypothetical protein